MKQNILRYYTLKFQQPSMLIYIQELILHIQIDIEAVDIKKALT
jgi:hypothetical protein